MIDWRNDVLTILLPVYQLRPSPLVHILRPSIDKLEQLFYCSIIVYKLIKVGIEHLEYGKGTLLVV